MSTNPNPPDAPGNVRHEGTVVAVNADGHFILKLLDGKELGGMANGPQLRRLGSFIGEHVTVLATVAAEGTLQVDGVLPAGGAVDPGNGRRRFSELEVAEMTSRIQALHGNRPEATEEEMDAMIEDDC